MVRLLAYTQPNPALQQGQAPHAGDVPRIWQGKSTFCSNLIEFAARLCYASTARMGTAPSFIQARVREGHEDVIEHAVATFQWTDTSAPAVWRRHNRHCEISQTGPNEWVTSANTRVWLDFFRNGLALEALPIMRRIAPEVYAVLLEDERHPVSPRAMMHAMPAPSQGLEDELATYDRYPLRVTLLGYTQPVLPDPELMAAHGSACFLFEGISRACTHQLVRHRLASFSQESQRYVQYESMESSLAPRLPRLPAPQQPLQQDGDHFSPDQEQFIARLYAEGFSSDALARAYDVPEIVIGGLVARQGPGSRVPRVSGTEHLHFFDDIDTPVKAQILGLIHASGTVSPGAGPAPRAAIEHHSDYRTWLKRLGTLWGGHVIAGGRDTAAQLTIPGSVPVNALIRHGAVSADGGELPVPALKGELARHFIRGYLEGAGHIGRKSSGTPLVISGPQGILHWIQREIVMHHREPVRVICHATGTRHTLACTDQRQVPALLAWLYEGFELSYAHPARLKKAAAWHAGIQAEFQCQLDVWADAMGVICPPKLDPETASIWVDAVETTAQAYADLRHRKVRKEDARFLLPNAARTRIVTTMNFAAWQHLLWLRAVDRAAQWEIRQVGIQVLKMLYAIAPEVFAEHWRVYQEKKAVL